MKGFSIDTPLEKYTLKGKQVFVKREDLQGDGYYLPPLGKIYCVKKYIEEEIDKNKPLTTLSIDGSWTGWLVGAICEEMNIEYYYSYPLSKKFNTKILDDVLEKYPNTKLNGIRANMTSIMFNIMKRQSLEEGWQTIPYGFETQTFINGFKERIEPYNHFDNLVLIGATGSSLVGLQKGFFRENSNQKIHCVNVSNPPTIIRKLKINDTSIVNSLVNSDNISIHKSPFDFHDRMEFYKTPFPTNQFWERKGWYWLEENIKSIKGSILFWNMGSEYTY